MRTNLQVSDFRFQISSCRSQISNPQLHLLLLLLNPYRRLFGLCRDPPPSTDDQLRDSLNSKAGDDYDRELLGDPAKPDGKSRVDERMQKKLQKELGPAAQREDKPKSPLLQVAEAMRGVQPRLGQRDSGERRSTCSGRSSPTWRS